MLSFLCRSLVLDAHQDLLHSASVEEDSARLLVGVSRPGEFPLTSQGSHLVSPGSEHFLALDAVDTAAEAGVASLAPAQRACLFPGEQQLLFHRNYSQAACLFECGLQEAARQSGLSCRPWYAALLCPADLC